MLKKPFLIYRNIFFLILAAVLIRALAGLLNTLFSHILYLVTNVQTEHIYLLVPLLSIIGVIILWCYWQFGGQSNKGISLIFEAQHGINDEIPLSLIPFSMIVT